VLFPLSPALALLGAYELESGTRTLSDHEVAAVNGATAANSEWQVYARDANFTFISDHREAPRKGSKLLDDRLFRRSTEAD